MGFGAIFHRKKKPNNSSSTSTSAATSPTSNSREILAAAAPKLHELELVFKKFDANGDGKISSSELGAIMESLGQHPTEEELVKMMKELDSNGDGFMDFEEFVDLNTKGVDSNEALENLRDAFSVYDLDGNGSISAEELYEVLRSLGDECTIADCKKMIRGVDCDGDGSIDFEEFKVMMMMGARFDTICDGDDDTNTNVSGLKME